MKKNFKIFLFWFIHCTWGILMTLIGAVAALALLITNHKPKKFGYMVYFVVGHNWGGLCLGPFFLVSDDCDELDSKTHESGHSIYQGLIFGPLFPFVVALPSALRYHLFNCKTQKEKYQLSGIIVGIALELGLLFILFAVIFSILTLYIIGFAIIGYTIIIALWLFLSEIKKMGNEEYGYYDIWFERDASHYGLENYKKNKNILKYE